jgi:hypothetical protein
VGSVPPARAAIRAEQLLATFAFRPSEYDEHKKYLPSTAVARGRSHCASTRQERYHSIEEPVAPPVRCRAARGEPLVWTSPNQRTRMGW